MKPIIIIKEKNSNGKFELTEQELKELVEQAYSQGLMDGSPKVTLPQRQYDRPDLGIPHSNINGGSEDKIPYPHNSFGDPISYCSTIGQPNSTTKLNGSAVSNGV